MIEAALRDLPPHALRSLADGLERGRLAPAYNRHDVASHVSKAHVESVKQALRALAADGMQPGHIARMLRLLAAEREAVQKRGDRVELVWTGPEEQGSATRDTAVVVKELFRQARKSVLVASYALDEGQRAAAIFAPLAERMDALPGLRARLFVNVQRPYKSEAAESVLLREFAERFRNEVWPGDRLPEVFYDPRALERGKGPKACLHAKCVVVDGEVALVTSANFTEAAHERNVEAGVLVRDAVLAADLVRQFESRMGKAGGFLRLALGGA